MNKQEEKNEKIFVIGLIAGAIFTLFLMYIINLIK
jgi:hypothetical protein